MCTKRSRILRNSLRLRLQLELSRRRFLPKLPADQDPRMTQLEQVVEENNRSHRNMVEEKNRSGRATLAEFRAHKKGCVELVKIHDQYLHSTADYAS